MFISQTPIGQHVSSIRRTRSLFVVFRDTHKSVLLRFLFRGIPTCYSPDLYVSFCVFVCLFALFLIILFALSAHKGKTQFRVQRAQQKLKEAISKTELVKSETHEQVDQCMGTYLPFRKMWDIEGVDRPVALALPAAADGSRLMEDAISFLTRKGCHSPSHLLEIACLGPYASVADVAALPDNVIYAPDDQGAIQPPHILRRCCKFAASVLTAGFLTLCTAWTSAFSSTPWQALWQHLPAQCAACKQRRSFQAQT